METPSIHVEQAAASVSLREPDIEIESVLVALPQKREIAAEIGSFFPDIGADSGDGKLVAADEVNDESDVLQDSTALVEPAEMR